MCGYDPFYWYEKDLDEEYKERFLNENKELQAGNDYSSALRNSGNAY